MPQTKTGAGNNGWLAFLRRCAKEYRSSVDGKCHKSAATSKKPRVKSPGAKETTKKGKAAQEAVKTEAAKGRRVARAARNALDEGAREAEAAKKKREAERREQVRAAIRRPQRTADAPATRVLKRALRTPGGVEPRGSAATP